jgi:predicted transposase YbfD/YdcC
VVALTSDDGFRAVSVGPGRLPFLRACRRVSFTNPLTNTGAGLRLRALRGATLAAICCCRPDCRPYARQAIKITRWRKDTGTGKASRQAVYAVTSLASAGATAQDLARLVREHWSVEAHRHIRDLMFGEDTAASRTGSGPVNLATIRAAIKDAGYLHIPEGRRDHTTPAETLRLHGLD